MNIVVFGPPASGKGTQSALIAEKFGMYHLIMSNFLKDEIKSGSEIGMSIEKKLFSGELISNDILCDVLSKNLKLIFGSMYKNSISGIIFDGVPRTLEQAVFLENFLSSMNSKIDFVLNFVVSDDVLIDRISSRFVCNECGASANCEIDCTSCNLPMKKRLDDSVEIFKNRLDIYNKMFSKIRDFFEKSNIKIIDVNANLSINDVQNFISSALQQ